MIGDELKEVEVVTEVFYSGVDGVATVEKELN